jgi:hypothetical protein
MTWQFGRIRLADVSYSRNLACEILDPVPVTDVLRVYRDYCVHKHFQSVMPMLPGRLTAPDTEIIGYQDQGRLVAWSMYRIWDAENILCDHHAWDYRNPRLRLGARSLDNECAIYRDRGYRWMYFESVEPYMLDLEGFEILGPIT